jgi:hypothetical protein
MSAAPTKITVYTKNGTPKVTVVEPTPTVVVPKKDKAKAVRKPRAPKVTSAVVVADTSVATETTTETTTGATETSEVVKPKRQRPKVRSFTELHNQIKASLEIAYKELQNAHRAFASLESAHKRELTTTKTRESSHRTPTVVFDNELVTYFRTRLEPSELVVQHKEGEGKVPVQLAELSTTTRVHRTDMTQLFNLIFKKHHMQDPTDGRNILYQQDPEFVKLLVSCPNPGRVEDIAKIHDNTFELTIFSMQKFISHHLSKVVPAAPAPAE